ncbi:hypothetical protein D3C71_1549690 [compost metagenome]
MAGSKKVPMKLVWQWRRAISAGYTLQEVTKLHGQGFSSTTIGRYTISQRAKVAEQKKADNDAKRQNEDLRSYYNL